MTVIPRTQRDEAMAQSSVGQHVVSFTTRCLCTSPIYARETFVGTGPGRLQTGCLRYSAFRTATPKSKATLTHECAFDPALGRIGGDKEFLIVLNVERFQIDHEVVQVWHRETDLTDFRTSI